MPSVDMVRRHARWTKARSWAVVRPGCTGNEDRNRYAIRSLGTSPAMNHRVLSIIGGLCAATWLITVSPSVFTTAAFGQSNDAAPATPPAGAGQEPAKETQKIDEFAEAERVLSGPAGNPECVWLGRRVVSLLWRDDLDTAFRHLDLYDRFGCPGGHIQASFRCLLLHASSIDPKAPDSLNNRVQACWLNPSLPVATAPAAAPAPSAAAPSPATTR
jgi:hypothetical protein